MDPDATSAGLLAAALVREGYATQVAASDREARKLLIRAEVPPSAVVAEIRLPDGDGFELCHFVRSSVVTATVPVALLSHRPQPGERERATAVGADEYLPKPILASDVVTWVRLRALTRPVGEGGPRDSGTLPLLDVLRALLTGMGEGALKLESGGAIFYRQGQVVGARFAGLSGEPALAKMLLLSRGAYSILPGAVSAEEEQPLPIRMLLSRFRPRVRTFREAVIGSVPLGSVLSVDFQALSESLPHLPDQINEVVRLFDGHRSVEQVLLAAALPESTMLGTVTQLFAEGVLVPAPAPMPARDFDPEVAETLTPSPAAAPRRVDEDADTWAELASELSEFAADSTPQARAQEHAGLEEKAAPAPEPEASGGGGRNASSVTAQPASMTNARSGAPADGTPDEVAVADGRATRPVAPIPLTAVVEQTPSPSAQVLAARAGSSSATPIPAHGAVGEQPSVATPIPLVAVVEQTPSPSTTVLAAAVGSSSTTPIPGQAAAREQPSVATPIPLLAVVTPSAAPPIPHRAEPQQPELQSEASVARSADRGAGTTGDATRLESPAQNGPPAAQALSGEQVIARDIASELERSSPHATAREAPGVESSVAPSRSSVGDSLHTTSARAPSAPGDQVASRDIASELERSRPHAAEPAATAAQSSMETAPAPAAASRDAATANAPSVSGDHGVSRRIASELERSPPHAADPAATAPQSSMATAAAPAADSHDEAAANAPSAPGDHVAAGDLGSATRELGSHASPSPEVSGGPDERAPSLDAPPTGPASLEAQSAAESTSEQRETSLGDNLAPAQPRLAEVVSFPPAAKRTAEAEASDGSLHAQPAPAAAADAALADGSQAPEREQSQAPDEERRPSATTTVPVAESPDLSAEPAPASDEDASQPLGEVENPAHPNASSSEEGADPTFDGLDPLDLPEAAAFKRRFPTRGVLAAVGGGILVLAAAALVRGHHGASEPETIPPVATSAIEVDAGAADAGDAGLPDAGDPNAGQPDAGEPDAGQPDAGQPDAGIAATEHAAEVKAALAKGNRLYDAGLYPEAIKLLSHAVELAPENGPCWTVLGLARFDSGDVKAAHVAADKALSLDKSNGRAWLLLATVQIEEGDRDKAEQSLRHYLAIAPNGEYADEARSMLEK